MIYNGTEYYYVKNLQGDIISMSDGTGVTVVTYKYDSWGKVLEISGSNQTLGQLNPFRYRGYYYDNETGFYYVSSRYYDPERLGVLLVQMERFLVLEIMKKPLKIRRMYYVTLIKEDRKV